MVSKYETQIRLDRMSDAALDYFVTIFEGFLRFFLSTMKKVINQIVVEIPLG